MTALQDFVDFAVKHERISPEIRRQEEALRVSAENMTEVGFARGFLAAMESIKKLPEWEDAKRQKELNR